MVPNGSESSDQDQTDEVISDSESVVGSKQLYDSADDLADVDEHENWPIQGRLSIVSAVMKKSCINNDEISNHNLRQTFVSSLSMAGRPSTNG